MRGKLPCRRSDQCRNRIIPAHAGQTGPAISPTVPRSDHPRACGANSCDAASGRIVTGSSPRMRGKRQRKPNTQHRTRIIPAHAGQTCSDLVTMGRKPDHPRACGANFQPSRLVGLLGGSSPRMRGKPVHQFGSVFIGRIIPAHAGQTRRRVRIPVIVPDHPRACGANSPILCENS